SAFFPSPFERAAILTLDGVGEWSTTTFGIAEGNRITLSGQLRFPHSLGLLYSAFTYYCGFRVNSGEYKLMGLAPYGRPVYRDAITKHLMDLRPDGSFRLDMRYFNYCQGLTMTGRRFHRLFGGPPRAPESRLEQRHMDRAASAQAGSLLGPQFSSLAVRRFLDQRGATYHRRANEAELLSEVAQLLADGNIVGCFRGRMEFGPRALGSRSILGDSRSPRMQSKMN